MAENDTGNADKPTDESLEQEAIEAAVDGAFDDPSVAGKIGAETDAEERVLRAQAELENFRKRSQRELAEQRKYAGLPLMRDLLVVLDNLELAVNAAADNEHAAGLLEGVRMVAVQFNNVLQQHSCHTIPAVGAEFDPNLHEAAGQEPSDAYPSGVISRELRVGYQLHDRVVRPSQVFISSGAAADANDQEQEQASSEE